MAPRCAAPRPPHRSDSSHSRSGGRRFGLLGRLLDHFSLQVSGWGGLVWCGQLGRVRLLVAAHSPTAGMPACFPPASSSTCGPFPAPTGMAAAHAGRVRTCWGALVAAAGGAAGAGAALAGAQSKGWGASGAVGWRACRSAAGGRAGGRADQAWRDQQGDSLCSGGRVSIGRRPGRAGRDVPPACPCTAGPTHPQLVGLLAEREAGGAGNRVHEAVGVLGVAEAGGVRGQLVAIANCPTSGRRYQRAKAQAAVQVVLQTVVHAAPCGAVHSLSRAAIGDAGQAAGDEAWVGVGWERGVGRVSGGGRGAGCARGSTP